MIARLTTMIRPRRDSTMIEDALGLAILFAVLFVMLALPGAA